MKRSFRFVVVFLFICAGLMLAMTHVQAQTALPSGEPVSLTLSPGTYTNHYIDVPARATKLTVTLSADLGDLDLFLKYGSPLQGANYGELYDGADFVSTAVDSHERIEVTPSSTPPLREGWWYITPVNLSQIPLPITFTVTATVDVAPSETKHKLTMSLLPASATPSSYLSWGFEVQPGTTGNFDIYALLSPPGGPLYFLNPFGLSAQLVPYQLNAEPKEGGVFFIKDVPLPAGLPAGEYLFGALLVKSFSHPLNADSWASDVSLSSMTFNLLSPAQQYFVQQYGYPHSFIKTFGMDNGRFRTDETWLYTQQGLRLFFVNGVLMKNEEIVATGLAPLPSRFRPDYYHFDTTEQALIDRHGQPGSTQSAPPGSGQFFSVFRTNRHLLYDSVVFGFMDERLIFVLPGK